jgi:hypothetical protein
MTSNAAYIQKLNKSQGLYRKGLRKCYPNFGVGWFFILDRKHIFLRNVIYKKEP